MECVRKGSEMSGLVPGKEAVRLSSSDPDPRKEVRIPATEPVQLSSQDERGLPESTYTLNISPHGARVVTQRTWKAGSRLVIKSLRSDFSAQARLVYWRSFGSRIVIGLEFLSQAGRWPKLNLLRGDILHFTRSLPTGGDHES